MVRNLIHIRRESETGAAQNSDRGVFREILCGFCVPCTHSIITEAENIIKPFMLLL